MKELPIEIKINVTQEHIDGGTPLCNEGCAIAFAVLDALDLTVGDVSVESDVIHISNNNGVDTTYRPLAKHEEIMSKFVRDYDDYYTEGVTPISFNIVRQ